jgi:thioesterase superfamily protein
MAVSSIVLNKNPVQPLGRSIDVTGSSRPDLDGEIRDGRHLMTVRVYYEDTDFSGIVYHANYLRFMERGRTNHLRLLGAGHRTLFEEAQQEAPGFAFVVRSMQIEFLKPARDPAQFGLFGGADDDA